jgi:hypothetical protein
MVSLSFATLSRCDETTTDGKNMTICGRQVVDPQGGTTGSTTTKRKQEKYAVVDCRQRNDNTIKDVTPFPDQDQIRMDVAQAKYHSKIDLSNAYKQIRVEPDDVHKTAFATVFGTHKSNVMQQGDCNGPTTFQRLVTMIFHDVLGIYVHVYLMTYLYSALI